MFNADHSSLSVRPRLAIAALALLSLTTLLVAVWILADFSQELEVLKHLASHLPASDLPETTELARELRFQSHLSLALILITIASSAAMTLLARAYLNSERSLRETRVLATDILASIDQGIITTDQNARILSVNPYGEALLEQSPENAPLGFPSAHQTLEDLCQRVLMTRHSIRDKDYEVDASGHPRTLRAGCSLLRDHREQVLGAVIHVRDVTERALIEQRLRRMERYMSLGSLAAGLQHEIKNPLAALALHVQLLGESLADERCSSETQATLDVLRHETKRITDVLEGFRDFASVERLNCSSVDLVELIDRAVGLVRPQADVQGVQIEAEVASAQHVLAFIDPGRMEQVLLNLMLNALAAMPEGGVLKISARITMDSAVIEVLDNGSGIPKDLASKVFDPYFTTRGAGTGMGLAICEKIISQHNGVINLESASSGTRVVITLPGSRSDLEQPANGDEVW